MYKSLAKTLFVGKKLIFLTTCHSTNEEATDRLRMGSEPDGTLIITENQTRGRGQMNNVWLAEPGRNLTFSVIFYPAHLAAKHQFALNISISLGITDVLSTHVPGVQVKWPNDIYIQDHKLGGILIQNTLSGPWIRSTVAGIGLNINQTNFTVPQATSLALQNDKQYELSPLLEEVCLGIEARYLQLKGGDFSGLLTEYKNRLYRFGQEALYNADEQFIGKITDVRLSGELVMDTKQGPREFRFKEVEFI